MLVLGLALLLGGYGVGFWLLTSSGDAPRVAEGLWDCFLLTIGVTIGWLLSSLKGLLDRSQRPATTIEEPCRAMDV
jgi:hypothetical protein